MTKDIAIAISVGSPNSTWEAVHGTFSSIDRSLRGCDWKIFLYIGEKISQPLRKQVFDYVATMPGRFEVIGCGDCYWADFINLAILRSAEYKYFIKSHDDIVLLSPNFFEKISSFFCKQKQPLGWVSFTDVGWRLGDFSPSTRPGHHIDFINSDAWGTGRIFQFAKWPEYWYRSNFVMHHAITMTNRFLHRIQSNTQIKYPKPIDRIARLKVDMPTAPCYCHAPFNHFVLIQRSSLDLIGPCENWQTYNALLVDEDWGLRALRLNLPNVWLPDVEYIHRRPDNFAGGGTRSSGEISSNSIRVEELFKEKWGFPSCPQRREEIEFIQSEYRDTLIPWSSYKNSFEWDYLNK